MQHRVTVQGCLHRPELGDDSLKGGPLSGVLVPALLHQLNVLVVQPQLAPRRLLPVWDFWTCLVVNHLYTYIELLIMGFCLCD